jgi:hypothetical protein
MYLDRKTTTSQWSFFIIPRLSNRRRSADLRRNSAHKARSRADRRTQTFGGRSPNICDKYSHPPDRPSSPSEVISRSHTIYCCIAGRYCDPDCFLLVAFRWRSAPNSFGPVCGQASSHLKPFLIHYTALPMVADSSAYLTRLKCTVFL